MSDITAGSTTALKEKAANNTNIQNDEVFVSEGKTKISDLWKKEDWLAVWIGFILIRTVLVMG